MKYAEKSECADKPVCFRDLANTNRFCGCTGTSQNTDENENPIEYNRYHSVRDLAEGQPAEGQTCMVYYADKERPTCGAGTAYDQPVAIEVGTFEEEEEQSGQFCVTIKSDIDTRTCLMNPPKTYKKCETDGKIPVCS